MDTRNLQLAVIGLALCGLGALACSDSSGNHVSGSGGTTGVSSQGTGGASTGSGVGGSSKPGAGGASSGVGGSSATGAGGVTITGVGGKAAGQGGKAGPGVDGGLAGGLGTGGASTGAGGKVGPGIDAGKAGGATGSGGSSGTVLGGNNGGNPPEMETCVVQDTYDTGNKVCYVDSVNGSDSNDGLSQDKPVKSQTKVSSSCTVVRFKRGSVFKEKLRISKGVKVYTNYGPSTDKLPWFIVDKTVKGAGPVVLTTSPVTIDGVRLSGARGDGTMAITFQTDANGITAGIVGGLGIFAMAATKFLNSEVDDCDIGIMLGAEGGLVQGNYVHDLYMAIDAPPGVDPNLVGGAEGIFVNASNNEVSYNSFVNCSGAAVWVGANGDCDGGATEVSLGAGATMTGVNVHHNFSYNSCGFLEIASYFGGTKGTFKSNKYHNNLIVDSAWQALLQVNNTNMEDLQFYNNTLIQHPGTLNQGILFIKYTATSSGMSGGDIEPNTIFLTNNLYVFDGITDTSGMGLDKNIVQKNTLVVTCKTTDDPNCSGLGFANHLGRDPTDYDLVSANPKVVDVGADIDGNTLDYFNRTRPAGSAPDLGAMEYGAKQAACLPARATPGIATIPARGTRNDRRDAAPYEPQP